MISSATAVASVASSISRTRGVPSARTDTARDPGVTASTTRIVYGGGSTSAPTHVDTIGYNTIATAGNATDFGNLQSADRYGCTGSASTTRGLFCGGGTNNNIEDTIDYFTIGRL